MDNICNLSRKQMISYIQKHSLTLNVQQKLNILEIIYYDQLSGASINTQQKDTHINTDFIDEACLCILFYTIRGYVSKRIGRLHKINVNIRAQRDQAQDINNTSV